jgi:hypothetical protein
VRKFCRRYLHRNTERRNLKTSTVREISIAAKECTPSQRRPLWRRSTYFFICQKNVREAHLMRLLGSHLVWECDCVGSPFLSDIGSLVMLRTHAAMALLLHEQPDSCMTTGSDAFNFFHSSLRMHVEQAFGILVQRFVILWQKLTFSLPACILVLSACFRLHNFCIDIGEESLRTVLQSEDRIVSDSSFRRWLSAMRKARADQISQILRGRRRDLEASELREHMTHDPYQIGCSRPR